MSFPFTRFISFLKQHGRYHLFCGRFQVFWCDKGQRDGRGMVRMDWKTQECHYQNNFQQEGYGMDCQNLARSLCDNGKQSWKMPFLRSFVLETLITIEDMWVWLMWGADRGLSLLFRSLTLNSGWNDIPDKVGRFVGRFKPLNNVENFRLANRHVPYAEAFKSSKWVNRPGTDVDGADDWTSKRGNGNLH